MFRALKRLRVESKLRSWILSVTCSLPVPLVGYGGVLTGYQQAMVWTHGVVLYPFIENAVSSWRGVQASSVNSDSSVAGSSGVYRTANKLGMTDRDFFAAFTLTMTFSYILIFVIGVALYPVAKLLMARCKPGSSNFRNTIGAALRKYVASPRL
ncbi:hypothetical protein BDZ88DRAFT_48623 [Geranomyces variabilis]|nr:hypothetical protein BDZ88DRAFT_48623 [Geranomyces variabilis]